MACTNITASLDEVVVATSIRRKTLRTGTPSAPDRAHMHLVRRGSMESVITSRVVRSLTQRARIVRVIVASTFAALFIAGCSSSTDFSPITSLTVAPASATLAAGGTQQFTVVTKDANGKTITGTTPTWSVVAGGGTISATGLFTAGTTAGTYTNTVAVTCSGVTSFATVIIT